MANWSSCWATKLVPVMIQLHNKYAQVASDTQTHHHAWSHDAQSQLGDHGILVTSVLFSVDIEVKHVLHDSMHILPLTFSPIIDATQIDPTTK